MGINHTMQKECVTTVTTGMDVTKNLGNVLITNCMQMECAKTVILMNITERKGKKVKKSKLIVQFYPK